MGRKFYYYFIPTKHIGIKLRIGRERESMAANNETALSAENLRTLEKMLSDMKFGSITIIVQDGKIIQIDKTEKVRVK